MWAPGRAPVLGADTPWSEAIDHPGAFQMGHLRRLFESRPWETLERLGARDLTAWWSDPRYGRAYFAHTGVGTGIQVFPPPSSGRACDWVLVLDDPEKGYPPPGDVRR